MRTIPHRLIDELGSLHRRKHEVYGDSWKKRGELVGVFANLARKVDRLEHHQRKGTTPDGETVAETLLDLLIYGVKYLTYLAEQDDALARRLFPDAPDGSAFSDDPGFVDDLLRSWCPTVTSDLSRRSLPDLLDAIGASLESNEPPANRAPLAIEFVEQTWVSSTRLPEKALEGFISSSEVDES